MSLFPEDRDKYWPIPNPSYCSLFKFDSKGRFTAYISPELATRWGPLERAGTILERIKVDSDQADSYKNDSRMSREEFLDELTKRLYQRPISQSDSSKTVFEEENMRDGSYEEELDIV
jgi:hypothetical protein